MIITYFERGTFRLQSGELNLLIDPLNNRLKADVVLESLSPTDAEDDGDSSHIRFPGEYEIKGIEIQGFSVPVESTEKYLKTIYSVLWEDIRFLFLGHISKLPDSKLLEKIPETDVLFIPSDGNHFLSAADASKLVKQIEPSIVIPSFYKDIQPFLKAIGHKAEPQEKFVFKKKDLSEEAEKVILLEPKA